MKIFELTIGGITIAPTYYALMYVLGFVAGFFFLKKFFVWKKMSDLDDFIFAVGLGVILGGRLGFVILYDLSFYLSHPLEIFAIWKGGMSFHGGLIGVILATIIFAKKSGYRFWQLIDSLAVIVPVGLGFGRFGNFLNNELYGFADYNGPFAMMIRGVPHFPSPLLELVLEGLLLGIILMYCFFRTNAKNFPGKLSGIFLVGYAISRIIVEFFRLPDANIGYLLGTNFLTLGMMYSLPMLIFGIFLLIHKQ